MVVAAPNRERVPQRLRDIAGDERTQRALQWIAQRHRLTEADKSALGSATTTEEALDILMGSQVFQLTGAVGAVLLGELHPNYLIRALSERLGVSMDEARAIAHDVSREIFSHVKQELVDLYRIAPRSQIHEPQPFGSTAEETSPASEVFEAPEANQALEANEAGEAPVADGLASQVEKGTFPPSEASQAAEASEAFPAPEAIEANEAKEAPPVPEAPRQETQEDEVRFAGGATGPNVVDLRNIDNMDDAFAPPPPQNNP